MGSKGYAGPNCSVMGRRESQQSVKTASGKEGGEGIREV